MLFVELRFFLFFGVVFGTTWMLRRNSHRKLWLLAASYFFYAAWDWRFLSLILLSTVVDYLVGLRLDRTDAPRRRRLLLVLSLVVNLGCLAIFKYLGFFVESAVALLSWFGFAAPASTLNLVLPVGISFYTFQTLSYTIDVYRKKIPCTDRPLDFALFVAFFPQLVAGPIVRAREFLPQLREAPRLASVCIRPALLLFLLGYFKKACVADNLAFYADVYFADPSAFDGVSSWIAILCYSVQVYCDFSGYSDMAIAGAALLGYRLCENFRHPFLAVNLAQFWRRWHISLSTWLRDYLYIPLGGGRGGPVRRFLTLMAVMTLGGLWHGAAWTYVIWGGLHGVGLAVHRVWSQLALGERLPRLVAGVAGMALTFWFFNATLIIFRSQSFSDAGVCLRSFLTLAGPGSRSLPPALWIHLTVLAAVHVAFARTGIFDWLSRRSRLVFAIGLGVAFALCLSLLPNSYRPFIYFQF